MHVKNFDNSPLHLEHGQMLINLSLRWWIQSRSDTNQIPNEFYTPSLRLNNNPFKYILIVN